MRRKSFGLDYLLVIAVAIIIFGINLMLSYNQVIDHFTYSSIGLAQSCSESGRLVLYPYSGQPGWNSHADSVSLRFVPTLLLVFLEQTTGISLKVLAFLPIGGLMLAVLSYVLAKNLTGSAKLGLLFALAMAFEPVNILNLNIYYISVGLLILCTFLIVWSKSVKSESTVKHPIILVVLFLAAFLSYYTSEFLILLIVFMFATFIVISKVFRMQLTVGRKFGYLALAFLVLFMALEPVFYQTIGEFSENRPIQTIEQYFQYISKVLTGNTGAVTEYKPHYSNMLPIYAYMLQMSLVALSGIVYILHRIRQIRREKSGVSVTETVFFTLLFVGAAEPLVYLFWGGGIAFRSLLWFGLLAAFCSLHRLGFGRRKPVKLKRLQVLSVSVVAVTILCCSIVKGVVPLQDPVSSVEPLFFDKMSATASWIALYVNDTDVVTDGRFAAQLFAEVTFADKQAFIHCLRFGPKDIDFLWSFEIGNYSSIGWEETPSVLALAKSLSTRSFDGGDIWQTNPPLGGVPECLYLHPALCRVFDDGRGLVYVRD